MRSLITGLVLALSLISAARAETVIYDFDIETMIVNKAGTPVEAIAIDGQIPAPLIEAREGDLLRVTFHNRMAEEASVHWHGILLPPDQDGVPFLNTRPIAPGASFTFEFTLRQSGTYWYHSHTGLQEQRGLYGPIRILPRVDRSDAPRDVVLVWSDWTNEKPDRVLRNLKRDGDYYARRKGSVLSWDRVIGAGAGAIRKRLRDALNRMPPMDLSDIAYDAFLANGEPQTVLTTGGGETVRVRMINAAASSYFNVEFASGPMTIIAADGIDVEPLKVRRLSIALAETYDVLVRVPATGRHELRATANDGTGHASAWLGSGARNPAPDIPRPDPFAMDHGGMQMGAQEASPMDHAAMDHGQMDHSRMAPEAAPDLTDYTGLRALTDTRYPAAMPLRVVDLTLTGNMERYVWSFNNRTLSESDRILIRAGERVQFRFTNKTMMAHPLHLHGHFFRVLNGEGPRSPLKHTVNVPAMGAVTIEFAADETGDWFFHCHNLYHMKAGMARVVSYTASSAASDAFVRSLSRDSHWYGFADVAALSNQVEGRFWLANNRYEIELEGDTDMSGTYEVEAVASRVISRYLAVFAGIGQEREDRIRDRRAFVGGRYTLPLLIDAELRLEDDGHWRLALGSELDLTSRLSLAWDWNTDDDHEITLDYVLTDRWSAVAGNSADYGWGIGIKGRF